VRDTGFEPADITAHKEFRQSLSCLVRAAPCVYQIAVEGKELPWWQVMSRSYEEVCVADKLTLLQLTSEVEMEWLAAARIQHHIYCNALTRAASAVFAKSRTWWSWEVQHNVSQHMGWLSKALSTGVLKKSSRGDLVLGEQRNRYKLMPFDPALGLKYKRKAILTTALAAMPVPRSLREYLDKKNALHAMPSVYHDLWYFRALFEAERALVWGNSGIQRSLLARCVSIVADVACVVEGETTFAAHVICASS